MASAIPVVNTIRTGDATKANPFTICIIANPALEAPWQSGQFMGDPITGNQAAFDACVRYVNQVLFGRLAGQSEQFLADPQIEPKVRLVSLFVSGLSPQDANSLVGQDPDSDLLIARRNTFRNFMQNFGLDADVAYAVSASNTHTRSSAWFTSDDDSRPGVGFTLDGVSLTHRYFSLIPGTIAMHLTATSLTALHEFGHALSSYSNGKVVDLYVDSNPALNCKAGRPIPPRFGSYVTTPLAADISRDSLGYPPGWNSYHCELNAPFPAVMDDYWLTAVPERCEHDKITRQFLKDRVSAKIQR